MGNGPRFITDEKGQRIAVVLDIAQYERMLEELEDQEDVRAYDAAMALGETPIPYVPLGERLKRQPK